MNLGRAIAITTAAFEGKTDKAGVPYILHCLHVMNSVHGGESLKIAAVLHDLIEDTDWTLDGLRKEGFSDRVVNAVELLTHYPVGHPLGMTYMAYVKRLASNKDAKKVKMADLRHNSDIHRMKGISEKDFSRLTRYHKAYAYLRDYDVSPV